MDKIYHKGKLVGIKISSMDVGSVPITTPKDALQLLTLKHKKGSVVKPHTHSPAHRETEALEECLVVVKGKLRVTLYDERIEPFEHVTLHPGEAMIILTGGHGVEYLEDSEVFEFKNGPFIDDKQPLSA